VTAPIAPPTDGASGLGLEPKRKDWRPASLDGMPKRMTKHFEQGRELGKEAKGLR
jgi:hypothetical protein